MSVDNSLSCCLGQQKLNSGQPYFTDTPGATCPCDPVRILLSPLVGPVIPVAATEFVTVVSLLTLDKQSCIYYILLKHPHPDSYVSSLLGRWWAGQDQATVATLLRRHTGTHLCG